MNYRLLTGALILASFITLSGCGSSPKHKLSEQELSRYADMNAETIVNNAKAKLVKAREDELHIYAPLQFDSAAKTVAKGDEMLKDKDDKEKIIPFIASAEKDLQQGYAVKQQVFSVLGNVIKLDAALIELSADTLHPEEYKKLNERVSEQIKLIGEGKIEEAQKNEPPMRGDMEALKIRITKQNVLGNARKLLDKLKKEDGSDYAPETLQLAEQAYSQADAFIQTYPDDADGIAKVGLKAMSAAQRAQNVIARVKMLHNKPYKELEKIVHNEESWLTQVAVALESEHAPGQPLERQAARLAEAVAATRKALIDAQKALATEQKNSNESSERIKQLEASGTASSQTIARLEADNSRLQAQVDLLNSKITTLEGQIDILKQTMGMDTAPAAKTPVDSEDGTAPAEEGTTETQSTGSETAPAAEVEAEEVEPAPAEEKEAEPVAEDSAPADEPTATEEAPAAEEEAPATGEAQAE